MLRERVCKAVLQKNILNHICTNCVMDTSDEDITFDENGVCMRCNEYKERILPEWNYGKGHEKELAALIDEIKQSGMSALKAMSGFMI